MNLSVRRGFLSLGGLGILGLVALAFVPRPVSVDLVQVSRGPMQVTVDEEGMTRAHDRFTVAAPVSGRLARIELHEGETVELGQIVAWIHLLPLDPQQRAEIGERVETAQALEREAAKSVERARASHGQARRERERVTSLAREGLVTAQALEQARVAELTAAKELEAAQYRAEAAAHQVKVARAGMMGVEAQEDGSNLVELRSPVVGQVLRVLEKSERVVPAGTPLLELGDVRQLEVVTDVLSTDAVKIPQNAPVLIEGWGGRLPLRGRVRTVEPSAFTKVSALGVEEQRVNVVIDLLDPPGPLGDGYRVETRIIIWEAENALRVPASAVFRHGPGWAVFAVESQHVRRQAIEIGHRNALEVELVRGLDEGTKLVAHPQIDLDDGVRVAPMPGVGSDPAAGKQP